MDSKSNTDILRLISNFVTFNCKNVKRSFECIRNLCKDADIVALQETWLMSDEIPMLGDIDSDFGYYGKSSMDVTKILRGRPYGGIALLWRKTLFTSVSIVECRSDRIAAIKIHLPERVLLVFCVYMPTDSNTNLVEFCECMGEIAAIVESTSVESVYVLGDFNADPRELFGKELMKFCSEQGWSCADMNKLGFNSETYTFVSDVYGSSSWLDHCLVSEAAWPSVRTTEIRHGVYWSDHHPLILQLDLGMIPQTIPLQANFGRADLQVIWGERDSKQIECYNTKCTELLRDIDFPQELSLCCDRLCVNEGHRTVIDELYNRVVHALKEAAVFSYGRKVSRRGRVVVGWNKYVKDSHRSARQAFLNWTWYGKPRSGPLYRDMCETRKIFKRKLKYCQEKREQLQMNILATHHTSKNFSKFWKDTKKLSSKPGVPLSVNGVTEASEITNLFKRHFKVNPSPLEAKIEDRLSDESIMSDDPVGVTSKDVKYILKSMTRGKSPGHDGLSVEHLQNAGQHLPRVLALLYTICIRHSYLPMELMRTIVVPIIKNRTGDVSDKRNYRPISLATILAKVLDGLLQQQLSAKLNLHDAQFGFRPGLSTETAVLSLKRTVGYYTQRNTPVYAAFLDLSKAFDLVNYDLLWTKLRKLKMPIEIINTFEYWYGHQVNQVRWSGVLSEEYTLECGVRQGGLTSPALFSLYVNELLVELSDLRVGCSIDGVMVNSISYADDMVLLCPSIGALRKLLSACEKYAKSHGLRYNVEKSEFMVFRVSSKKPSYVPPVVLLDTELKRVTQFKYLGHILDENLSDNSDIERERRALAVRCNMLARRFSRCTKDVKITLFKSFCQSFYTCSLWVNYTQRAVDALRVQYNNAFRMLMGLPRFCSASGMFAEAHVDDYYAIIRKRSASILRRVRGSTNGILEVIKDKFDCPFYRHWIGKHLNGSQKYFN